MNFQIHKDDYFEIIYERLLFGVTKFNPIFELSDGQYPILGEFGRFLVENISDDKILTESLKFISEVFDKGGYKSKDLIIQQVFDQIYKDTIATVILSKRLNGEALKVFIAMHDNFR